MRRTIQRAAILVIGSSLLGLAVNQFSPRRIPWRRPREVPLAVGETVTLEQARQLWETGGTFFIDARAPADYRAGHSARAFNLPEETFPEGLPTVARAVTPDSDVVVYCDGELCELSRELAQNLRAGGYKHVRVLENGWTLWQRAGYPTETGNAP